MDTIFALASAPGKAGVSVIRVSGPHAEQACRRLAGEVPLPRQAALRRLTGRDGNEIDEGLVLWFPEGASFTGDPVVEFQVHGSVAVIQTLLSELGRMDGLRFADPGEFTRRALLNGRMDLAQVEALADLIDAETEAQRRQAQRVLSGAFSEKVAGWRADLVRAAALLEATIDFADEDVPEDVSDEVLLLLSRVVASLRQEIAGAAVAERVRTGFEVAIVGPPNAGKSTLLNRLAGRDAALTSEVAGTTRDVIEVRFDLKGLPVTFLDTAGLRDSSDKVENLGIARARERAEMADLRCHLVPVGEQPLLTIRPGDLVLTAKDDLGSAVNGVSGATGVGIDDVLSQIHEVLSSRVAAIGLASRDRQADLIGQAVVWLEAALDLLPLGPDVYDVASHEVRGALLQLERLLGSVDVEDLLDEIFSSFCVGK